jgi:vanillate O-demethylase monooxygenase subunit
VTVPRTPAAPLLPLDTLAHFWHVATPVGAVADGPTTVELAGYATTIRMDDDGTPFASDPGIEVQARYGYLWCCRTPALAPLPDIPELDDPALRVVVPPPYTWHCSALRRLENFVDFQHFAWVHEGLLGTRDNPFVPEHEVVRVGDELRFSAWISEPNEGAVKRQLGLDGDSVVVENRYRVFPASAVLLQRHFPEGARYFLFASATPLAEDRCRTHWWIARNYALDESDDAGFVSFEDLILDADRPIVESQRPSVIPGDVTAELHIRDLDRVSLAYRRLLSDLATTKELQGSES